MSYINKLFKDIKVITPFSENLDKMNMVSYLQLKPYIV